MTTVARGQNIRHVYNGVKILHDKGMTVYSPTEKELQLFRDRSQKPVIEFLEKSKIDKKWIEMAIKAAKEAETD